MHDHLELWVRPCEVRHSADMIDVAVGQEQQAQLAITHSLSDSGHEIVCVLAPRAASVHQDVVLLCLDQESVRRNFDT